VVCLKYGRYSRLLAVHIDKQFNDGLAEMAATDAAIPCTWVTLGSKARLGRGGGGSDGKRDDDSGSEGGGGGAGRASAAIEAYNANRASDSCH
jgi:hypothetical protein